MIGTKPILTMDDIVEEGDPILRTVTNKVTFTLSDEIHKTLKRMIQFLKNSQDKEVAKKYKLRPGIGLSANQLGIDKRMSVVYYKDENNRSTEHTFINPEMIAYSDSLIYLMEGESCLSVNRIVAGFVPRYEWIKVRAYDIDCEENFYTFRGLLSIIVQHEIDHLNGIMFYDHIDNENLGTLSKCKPI